MSEILLDDSPVSVNRFPIIERELLSISAPQNGTKVTIPAAVEPMLAVNSDYILDLYIDVYITKNINSFNKLQTLTDDYHNEIATAYFACLLFNGGSCDKPGGFKDESRAKAYAITIEYWLKTHSQGCGHTQFCLGFFLWWGVTGPRNISDAFKHFKLSAVYGHVCSLYFLGLSYHDGYGVDIDDSEAVKYFRQAASAGFAPAIYHLGYCYYNGEGVNRNLQTAFHLLQRSLGKNFMPAKQGLELFLREYPDIYHRESKWRPRLQALWLASDLADRRNIVSSMSTDVVRVTLEFLSTSVSVSSVNSKNGVSRGSEGVIMIHKNNNSSQYGHYNNDINISSSQVGGITHQLT